MAKNKKRKNNRKRNNHKKHNQNIKKQVLQSTDNQAAKSSRQQNAENHNKQSDKDTAKTLHLGIYDILFILIMILGVFVRIYRFGSLPDGINQDEAFAGYEAYSLLHYGKDSFGYGCPVYFVSWGSGMNVLNSYLMIPFIALFGLKTWVIRLPQLLVAIFTLITVYLTMKKLFDEKAGLVAAFILAVVPWHIMLARWGLESNLAPGFLMFGMYFFIRGMEKSGFYIVSALMYGLSLYSYATIWPFVPLIILLEIMYAVYKKSIKINKDTIISFVVLGVLAMPLFLFLLVNSGRIDEIKTKFISIPKLLYMRSGEVSLKNIPDNFKNFKNIMMQQNDGFITNVYGDYGFLYKLTLIFFAFGLIMAIFRIIKSGKKFKNREDIPQILLLIQFIVGFIITLIVYVNVNRANCIMIPIILIAAYGIYELMEMLDVKVVAGGVAIIYLFFFFNFTGAYFKSYNDDARYAFSAGLEEAMEFAAENVREGGNIYVTSSVAHSRVMFYSKIPVDEYIDTVVYNNYPGAYIGTDSFGRYIMSFDIYSPDPNGIYILDMGTDTSALQDAGFAIKQCGIYEVAYHE